MLISRIRTLLVGFFLILTSACAPLNGNVHLLQVDQNNRLLYGPWKEADTSDHIIGKQDPPSLSNEDSFTLYFDQAFFKYMPDLWGENEIVVVFTFNEGENDSDEHKIVKIIGPMERIGDGSYTSSIGNITYGPKRVEGDVISVQIQVVEFDGEEKDNQSAFLDFIGSATEAFSLADPVTSAEISLAKEIAKILIQTNESDMVLDFKFDLLPKDLNTINKQINDGHRPISLRPGNWAIVKQEQCPLFRCYWPLTKNVGEWSRYTFIPKFFAFIGDLAFTAVPVTLVKIFADTPELASVTPLTVHQKKSAWTTDPPSETDVTEAFKTNQNIQSLAFDEKTPKLKITHGKKNGEANNTTVSFQAEFGSYMDDGKHISFEPNSRKLVLKNGAKSEPYEAKTWLTFSIEQGRDPSNWEKRKALSQTEEDLLSKIKEPSSLDTEQISNTLKKLETAKQKIKDIERLGSFRLITPASKVKTGKIENPQTFEFQHEKDLKVTALRFIGLNGKVLHKIEPTEQEPKSKTTTLFAVEKAKLTASQYTLFLDYEHPLNHQMLSAKFDFEVVEESP